MHEFRILSLVLLLLCSPLSVWTEERSVNPGINAHYENPDYQHWVNIFERPGREVFDRRYQILEATGLEQGMAVADIGAGTGLFTRLFAARVGAEGQVYAVDTSINFIRNIMRVARDQGFLNITGVVNTPKDTLLPPASIDLAFVCDTYHHFEYPRTILASIRDALRPDGSLVIVDFRKVPGLSSPWVLRHVRTAKQDVIAEIEAAGFELIEEQNPLRSNYFLRFRRR